MGEALFRARVLRVEIRDEENERKAYYYRPVSTGYMTERTNIGSRSSPCVIRDARVEHAGQGTWALALMLLETVFRENDVQASFLRVLAFYGKTRDIEPIGFVLAVAVLIVCVVPPWHHKT